jgi:hypothetical protein
MVTAVNSRDVFLQGAGVRTSKDFLSMEEKPSLISEYSLMLNTQTNLGASATTYGITTEKAAYDAAITVLTDFLATLTAPVAWNNLNNITVVNRATLTTEISDVYTAEKNLRTILASKQAVRAELTVPNISMPADTTNTVSGTVLAASGGTFKVFAGTLDITTGNGISYSVVSGSQVGCTVTINATTGVYVPSSITSNNASAIFRATLSATYGNMVIDIPYNLSKVKSGADGNSTFTLTVYYQGGTVPTSPSGGSYRFSDGVIVAPTGGGAGVTWSPTQPATTTTPTYACSFTFTGAASATVVGGTWSTPIVEAVNGTNGSPGASGEYRDVIQLYGTTTTAPAGTVYYNFNSNSIGTITPTTPGTVNITNWSLVQPAAVLGTPVYMISQLAKTTTPGTDVSLLSGSWTTAVKVAEVGATGSPGGVGNSSITVSVYYQGGTAPVGAITGGSYRFSDGAIVVPTGGGGGITWSPTQPATSTVPTYSTEFTFTGAPSATVSGGTWSTPIVEAVNGIPGTNGEYRDIIQLYGTTTTVPAVNVFYNFNSNSIGTSTPTTPGTVNITNWSLVQPAAVLGTPVYMISQLAKTTTPATDVLLVTGSWTTPVKVAEIGATGSPGTNGKALTMMADSLTFKVDKAGVATPTSINLTAMGSNLAGGSTAAFVLTSGTATLTGTGDARNFTYASMTTNSVTISVTKDGMSDVVTIVKLLDGIDTINGVLTNESHSLTANLSGAVTDYTGAVCTLNIFNGITNDNSNWSFSKSDSAGVVSSLSGNTVTITSITAGATSGYVDITATRFGFATVIKRFTISKAYQGSTGAPGSTGNSTFTVTVYYRGPLTPLVTASTGSYNFSTGALVVPASTNVTWEPSQPITTTEPTWATSFTFTGTAAMGAIAGGAWSAPRIEAQNGINGTPGVSGEFRDVIELYGTTQVIPTVTTYYNFTNHTISTTTPAVTAVTNWSLTMPTTLTVGVPIYMTTQLAKTTTPATDVTMPAGGWTTPVKVAERGSDGNSNVTATAYYQSPIPTSAAITGGGYVNSTQTLSTAPTGGGVAWLTTQPNTSTTKPVTYSTSFNYAGGSGTSGTTVTGGTWTTPVIEAVHGIPEMGGEFRDVIQLFGTTTTRPSGLTYYNFNDKTISTSSNSVVPVTDWSLTRSAASVGVPVYMITQTARTSTPATSVAMAADTAWSSPVVVNELFANGSYNSTVFAYYQTTAPSAVAITGGSYNFATNSLTVPTGAGVTWVNTQPSTTTSPTYATDFSFSGLSSATVTGGTWTAPRVEAVNGATGPSGEFRDTIQLYGFTTTRPTVTTYYNFSTNSISSSNSSQVAVTDWSLVQPAPTPGNPVYVITQFARTTNSLLNVAMLPNAGWTAPVVVAQIGSQGTQGLSYVTAYVASSVATTTTVPTQSTGVTSGTYQTTVPAAGTGGLGTVTWQKTVPVLTSGQWMYQTDGIYDPVAQTITWSVPYWSSLKVGSLAAVSTETGSLTVTGNIDSGSGATSWHVDSLGNMWSGAASFGAAPFSVTSTGVGKFNGSVQVGSAAISGNVMTGSGAQFNSSGTFAIGSPYHSVDYPNGGSFVYNGTSMYLTGIMNCTGSTGIKFVANSSSSVTLCQPDRAFSISRTSLSLLPAALIQDTSGYSNATLNITSNTTVPSVDISTTGTGGSLKVSATSTTLPSAVISSTAAGGALKLTATTTANALSVTAGKVHLNTSVPIVLDTATGNSGQTLISKGSASTPAWGKGMDSGAFSTDGSGNYTITVNNMQSSSFGISGTTTDGCFLVITAGPTLSSTNPDVYTIPVQTQFSTTGLPAANRGVRWLAIG